MGTTRKRIPEEYWQAIADCNSAYDDTFFYGVETTGIFCRPSCKSRVPKKENVRILKNAHIALQENFRPCKRCKPDRLKMPAEEWIGQIMEWIDVHYAETLTLQTLADVLHGSPYHLQRLFKRVIGMSPTEYIQHVRMKQAMQLLEATDRPIAHIGLAVGLGNTPYFTTFFKKKAGYTPFEYRKKKRKEQVNQDERKEKTH
ncbi:bifunctional transcriptional activator/DNA repair enzyme AdaA [Domibacillus sp. A3M-37]|uniref:bifunctional transcriptional activator/DNA repair enzyme AdaA n=1 Tax=Domibacillus sp. A3M-37 TaxID=2962037 RepID=UPI0020B8BE53|nr:bifunctional transcriptional activator/DNA repair enzyme AdaA [Domibacillus sp. A3M-37]MCP3763927.1 bifunctional transcriptional activator/DNA repair enzyme AdaA [Domibacillus sp. A3M-37]